MTSVVLLRVFFAQRRGERGRTLGAAKQPTRVIHTDATGDDERVDD